MTTPATDNTAYRAVVMAYRDAGLSEEGEVPNSEQIVDGLNRLNDLITFWQVQGVKVWLQVDQLVTLQAGKAKYSFMTGGDVDITKPTRIIDNGYYIDANNTKRPLLMLSRDEYTRLSNVVQQGPINSYFVEKLWDRLNVYMWLVPDAEAATGSVHLTIQQQVARVAGLTEVMQFPPEHFLWLRWVLADDLATGQPQAIMDRCAARATAYREALEAWDVEDASTLFQPDQRSAYVTGEFR